MNLTFWLAAMLQLKIVMTGLCCALLFGRKNTEAPLVAQARMCASTRKL